MSALEELTCDRVKGSRIVFEELAAGIDNDMGLVWRASLEVVLQSIVRKVVEDLKGEEVAGRRNISVPVKYRAIDNLDFVGVSSCIRRVPKTLLLQVCKLARDLNDLVLGPLIHLWVDVSDVVEDVQHHGTITSSHLVYDQIMVRIAIVLVVFNEISRDRFAIIG